ncbi:MAG: DEAD/DEAH box helicase family protein [Rhodospirillales bacterium]|nr:DEAD/DEAH box helicase family protein [Rhodospirillales bacterium]
MSAPALKFGPRAWQKNALRAWEKASRRGIAKVVTGGGKTVFAELCMSRVLDDYNAAHFVILVPTISLLDQWTLSLEDDFGVEADDIALWSGGKKPKEARTFNIAVINSARAFIGKIAGGNHPTMLIVDEVHRAASEQNAKALEGDFIATLGLSATPER